MLFSDQILISRTNIIT